MQKIQCIYGLLLRLFGWQNLLNTDLINQVFTFHVGQVRPLFIVGQMRPESCVITITSDRSFISNQ